MVTAKCSHYVISHDVMLPRSSRGLLLPRWWCLDTTACIPASRNVTIPIPRAAARSSSVEAFRIIMSRRSSFKKHQLEQPHAPFVTAPVAGIATFAAIKLLAHDVGCFKSNSASTSGVGVTSSLHCAQMRRTSRWASTASSVAVIKNGGTPMSRNRVMVLGASLVCSVLNTMCPVKEACTAQFRPSPTSRISPTRIMSGSCRRMARKQFANVLPIDASIGTCTNPVDVVLDRIFGRNQFVFNRVHVR